MNPNENHSRLLTAHGDLIAGRYDAARSVFEELATIGDAQALLYLGSMYERGLGVPVDDAIAADFYKRSCDSGNLTSCFFLGMLKYRSRDIEGALRWYRIAAEAGHPAAAYWIAQIYGDPSNLFTDQAEALRYLKMADRGGHAFAARDLAKKRMRTSGSIISKLFACAHYIKAIVKGMFIIAKDTDDPRVQ